MFKKIREFLQDRKDRKEFEAHMAEMCRFTYKDLDTGEIHTIIDNRLGINNRVVWCWNIEPIECVKL